MSKASVYFSVGNIDGKHGVKELKRELDTLPGVISVSANREKNHIAVDFDTTGVESVKIQSRLEKMGYEILDSHMENHVM